MHSLNVENFLKSIIFSLQQPGALFCHIYGSKYVPYAWRLSHHVIRFDVAFLEKYVGPIAFPTQAKIWIGARSKIQWTPGPNFSPQIVKPPLSLISRNQKTKADRRFFRKNGI